MYSRKLEKAFAYMIQNEGDYVFDKNDLGRETKFEITKRSYPALNIKDLKLEDTKKSTIKIIRLRKDLKKF